MLPRVGDEEREPGSVIPLRALLSAGTGLILAAAAATLLWNLTTGRTDGAAGLFALILLLAGALAGLAAMKDPTVSRLRLLEAAVFGALVVHLGWSAYAACEQLLAAGDTVGLVGRWNLTLVLFVLVLASYGVLIPNSPARAAVALTLIAAVPPAVATLFQRGPGVGSEIWAQVASVDRIAQAGLVLVGAIALGTSAAYVIDRYLDLAGSTRVTLRYELKRRIGQGGMGEVWLGEHNLLARPAAVKIIRPDVVESTSGEHASRVFRRFEREAKATAALRSTHTVEVYDFGVAEDGIFYYAMEYLDGVDLDTLVRDHGPLPAARAIYLLEQACRSLADAHHQGMVHRDIKPANIYACRMGTAVDFIKVLDFGLVTAGQLPALQAEAANLTVDGEIQGTPGYMAPELVVRGATEPDARVDIYALGCVAYYLLTGTSVFEGPPLSVLVEHARTDPEPPSSRVEFAIPHELDELVLRCLAKDPAERFASADELGEALLTCCVEPPWDIAQARAWWQLHLPQTAA